jgi:hypothetical protein
MLRHHRSQRAIGGAAVLDESRVHGRDAELGNVGIVVLIPFCIETHANGVPERILGKLNREVDFSQVEPMLEEARRY